MRYLTMCSLLLCTLSTLRSALRTRADLALENLALRQQLANLRRTCARPHLRRIDRAFWLALSLSLDKDAPDPRAIQPPGLGEIVELPEVGGLHHRYERKAA